MCLHFLKSRYRPLYLYAHHPAQMTKCCLCTQLFLFQESAVIAQRFTGLSWREGQQMLIIMPRYLEKPGTHYSWKLAGQVPCSWQVQWQFKIAFIFTEQSMARTPCKEHRSTGLARLPRAVSDANCMRIIIGRQIKLGDNSLIKLC